jgi:hypothetical protein
MRAAPLSFTILMLSFAASTLHAPASECAAYSGDASRVCSAAVDATRAFHPLLGVLVSGGNPVLGTGSPLGGLGHLSVTPRVNGVEVVLPRLSYDGSATPESTWRSSGEVLRGPRPASGLLTCCD